MNPLILTSFLSSTGSSTTTQPTEEPKTNSPVGSLFDLNGAFQSLGDIVNLFGCINTSVSPNKAKEEIAKDMPYLLKRNNLKNSLSLKNINNFIEDINVYIHARKIGSENMELAKCSREGNLTGLHLAQQFKSDTLTEIESKLNAQGKTLVFEEIKENHGLPAMPSGYHNAGMWYENFNSQKASFGTYQQPTNNYNNNYSNNNLDTYNPLQKAFTPFILIAVILGTITSSIIKNYKNKKPLTKNLLRLN